MPSILSCESELIGCISECLSINIQYFILYQLNELSVMITHLTDNCLLNTARPDAAQSPCTRIEEVFGREEDENRGSYNVVFRHKSPKTAIF